MISGCYCFIQHRCAVFSFLKEILDVRKTYKSTTAKFIDLKKVSNVPLNKQTRPLFCKVTSSLVLEKHLGYFSILSE